MLITKVPLLGGYISSSLSLKIILWKLSENGFHCIFNNKKICLKLPLAKMYLTSYLNQSKNKQNFLKMWFSRHRASDWTLNIRKLNTINTEKWETSPETTSAYSVDRVSDQW